MPNYYSTSTQFSPQEYADVLMQEYAKQFRTLYNYGARKVAMIGVGQNGCSPKALAQRSPDGKSLVNQFNANFPDARFIYVDSYGIFQDLINLPDSFGFSITNAGCCGVERNNVQITCLPLEMPCPNRDQYLFWDAFHPSDTANVVVRRRSYAAESTTDAYPIDIPRLALL